MKNFLHLTNPAGEVPGCLTPSGASPTLRHTKPVIIWGAYLAAKATGDFEQFRCYREKMQALLTYWHSPRRRDAATGLHVWADQMESGADDLVFSDVASAHTPGWSEVEHAFRVSSPDIMTFLVREHRAYALFLRRWAEASPEGVTPAVEAEISAQLTLVASLRQSVNTYLWHWQDEAAGVGWYCGYDIRTRAQLSHRTYQMAWPLWEGLHQTDAQRDAAVRAILAPDMRCCSGVRSTSSLDARYSNDNIIVPYR